jgi:hypothetical protein
MTHYKNLGLDSDVESYQIFENLIKVKFKDTIKIYTYSDKRATKFHVDNMKKLAIAGEGLNSYINKYVKFLYDK